MGFTGHRKAYDRARLLSKAEQARRRGRAAKAIELYRRVLAVEPDNADLHRSCNAPASEGPETQQR